MNTENSSGYSEMQLIKRRFFAMRNGVIADALRKGGSPYRIIFGLNLPQIVEIAAGQAHRRELAETLWADSGTRESRLLATMVYPVEDMSRDDAMRWLETAGDVETADIMCHRLLRRHPDAVAIAVEHGDDERHEVRYAARRLMMNLLSAAPADSGLTELFKPFATVNENDPRCVAAVSRQLADEIEWRQDPE
ncbi:MAG: DNA alkylation repair protein [Duncaniella sp.]|nr:DNA alkylation repair protein [Duncaniella sp.]